MKQNPIRSPALPPAASPATAPVLGICALLALVAPSLLAFNLSPSATLLNQLLAVGGWGAVLMALPAGWRSDAWQALTLPLMALGLLAASVALSWADALPGSMALSALLMLACAAAVMLAAQAGGGSHADGGPLWRGVLAGTVAAGVFGALIALVQVFVPSWADGDWIARSGLPGRAVGNLRQPNHLSTVLLWGLMAGVPWANRLRGATPLRRAVVIGLGLLMALGVVLTASRTGVVGIGLIAVWGLFDRRLDLRLRRWMMAAPLVYLAFWLAMSGWAHESQRTFGGEARLSEGDLSASRFGIWANTWGLIRAQPWSGVGFGEFNFAWTLTPFPGRPVAFFDHSHSLLLQFAVELGLPLAGLMIGLLIWALVQAFGRCWRADGEAGTGARTALMMALLAGLHSLFEYPLWYAYFLLPTAWALGHALRMPASLGRRLQPVPPPPSQRSAWALPLLGAALLAGALFAVWDYHRVVLIYQPGDSPSSLAERIRQGQLSPLFGHHADYAAATTGEPVGQGLAPFDSTTHALLDTRLMIAWANALAATGLADQVDQARHLAARLREFHNPASDAFFAPCAETGQQPPPFQCQPPRQAWNWRDFIH